MNRIRGNINDLLERKSKIERLLNICGNETFRLIRTVGRRSIRKRGVSQGEN